MKLRDIERIDMLETIEDVMTAQRMLICHLDDMIEQGLELAVYVFRYPIKDLQVINYRDVPVRKILFHGELMLSIELKPNSLDHNTVDTWIDGELSDLIKLSRSPLVAV